jgi:hypothetical protein
MKRREFLMSTARALGQIARNAVDFRPRGH